jgi:hypothetical protein
VSTAASASSESCAALRLQRARSVQKEAEEGSENWHQARGLPKAWQISVFSPDPFTRPPAQRFLHIESTRIMPARQQFTGSGNQAQVKRCECRSL